MARYVVRLEEREFHVLIDDEGRVSVDGNHGQIDIRSVNEDAYSVLIDGISTHVVAAGNGHDYHLLVEGKFCDVVVESERDLLLRKYSSNASTSSRRLEIRAPMPALVVRVEVRAGETIAQGQGLLVLEAMKMENEIKGQHPGNVKEVYVAEGDAVEKGQLLLLLE